MVNRLCKLPISNSFFLFGPRGTGKTTLIRSTFAQTKHLWIDLLLPSEEDRYILDPEYLIRQTQQTEYEWVIIDEVQKCPKLLNIVHSIIESKSKTKFVLTGSSSRRLKQKGINLLAGRAWNRNLFPLTSVELPESYSLFKMLQWGTLPKLLSLENDSDIKDYLQSYVLNYIKSEIQEEQWVRRLEPFRKFLPTAAQMNGKILNYSKIAKDVGVESNTIKSYYEILEDTLLGFHLPAFHKSIRKQQRLAAKFYFFDTGVKRALSRQLSLDLQEGTSEYGFAFEHWVILEIYRRVQYSQNDYQLSYFMSKDGLEIDLIIDRPGQPTALIEIKSTAKLKKDDFKSLVKIKEDIKNSEIILLSRDPIAQESSGAKAFYWSAGIDYLFA